MHEEERGTDLRHLFYRATEGFTPMRCASFVLKHNGNDQNRSNILNKIESRDDLPIKGKTGNQSQNRAFNNLP
jgi:hypothetical protein